MNGDICGEPFTWSARDQEFYQEKGYTAPKYCVRHRAVRKAQQKEREEQQKRREHSPFKVFLDEATGI